MISTTHLCGLLEENYRRSPNKEAFFYKKNGSYVSITYQKMALDVSHLSDVFQSQFHLEKGDRVAIMAHNSPAWVISDLATLHFSGVVVPIYPSLTDEEVSYILNNSKAKILILDTEEMVNDSFHFLEEYPFLEAIISIRRFETKHAPLYFMDDLLSQARRPYQPYTPCDPRNVASVVYTSGTTGSPKGVCLSHLNFLTNIKDIVSVLHLDSSLSVLSFLPLSHAFERTAGYYTVLAVGGSIYYAENMHTVANDLRLSKPTAMVSVPRVYEKIYDKVMSGSSLKRLLIKRASSIGSYLFRKPKATFTFFEKCQFLVYSLLVFNKFKRLTGGRLQFFVSGGAPLGRDLGEFFFSMGLLIIEGYGMTETSPVICCNRRDQFRFGTVGKPLPSVQVKLADDGELIVQGQSVMLTYYQNEAKTKDIIDEKGWLHTGDIAVIDNEGFITIIDRKKDIIVLSNGKKVPPQPIEQALMSSALIEQAIVIGEDKNFISALIFPNIRTLYTEARKRGVLLSHDALLTSPEAYGWIQDEVSRLQSDDARFKKIKKFTVLSRELTQESGELTPTLKPKRKIITQRYAVEIESMYSEH